MNVVGVLIAGAFGVWLLVWSFRFIAERHGVAGWLAAAILSAVIGAAVAVGLLLGPPWQISPTTKVQGFPFPAAVFVLEGDVWTDFVHCRLVMFGIMVSDVIVCAALAVLPTLLLAWSVGTLNQERT